MELGGISELVLETDDVEGLARFYRELGLEPILEEEGPVEHDGGDRSAYFFDPPATGSSSGTSSAMATEPGAA